MSTRPAELLAYQPATWLLRRLRSMPVRSLADAIRAQERAGDGAVLIIRAFYGLSLLWLVEDMARWPALRETAAIDPLWPAGWIDRSSPGGAITAIIVVYGTGTVLAAIWPSVRWFRALYFVGLFQYLSIRFGFGKINHGDHAWLWSSALFVLLPVGRRFRAGTDAAARHQILAVLWAAHVMVLFFYTLTGLWKFVYAVHALWSPRVSAFEIDGFALIVADRNLSTDQTTLLGDFLVANPVVGWLLYNGTIYLEAASLLIAFRPRLHRLWGFGLIAFHLGTQLAMGFTFPRNVALLALFFLASPWAPDGVSLRALVLDLPGVHLVARRLGWVRRS
jgi:hypothetical protein